MLSSVRLVFCSQEWHNGLNQLDRLTFVVKQASLQDDVGQGFMSAMPILEVLRVIPCQAIGYGHFLASPLNEDQIEGFELFHGRVIELGVYFSKSVNVLVRVCQALF